MPKEQFEIAIAEDIAGEVDELAAECDDPRDAGSGITEAILIACVHSETDHVERVRKLIIHRREGTP